MKESLKEYTFRHDVLPFLLVTDDLKKDLMKMSQQGLVRLGEALRKSYPAIPKASMRRLVESLTEEGDT